MPTVSLSHVDLVHKLGDLDEHQIENLCWRYGLELDEVTSEYEIVKKEQGELKAQGCSKDIIYKIEIPANRYDLLCVEGLTRALMIFEQKMTTPKYLKTEGTGIKLQVTASTEAIRPFIVAAVLRNVTLTESRYKSFIQLQDKLHQNIGKNRQIVSIGTHDLDTIRAPFTYTSRAPSDIRFRPLNETREFTAEELMQHYNRESHLKQYLPIIRDLPEYPVIYDSQGVLLSMPPIINGDHSKIHLGTRNIFIEVTGTNLHKISIALDTMVTMFSEYSDDQFIIEPVEVQGPVSGHVHMYPELTYRDDNVSVDYINTVIGTSLGGRDIVQLLGRMGLDAELLASSAVLRVTIPPTRHDIIHRRDIVEDVAVAYGYDNVPEHEIGFPSLSMGGDTPLNAISDKIRQLMVTYGFTEALSFVLCSRDDVSTKVGTPIECVSAVHVANPKTAEFQVARTSLLPGLLNTVQHNQHLALPLRVFEVQDVVLADPTGARDVGAYNQRRVCAVHYGIEPEFEDVYNVLVSLLADLGCRVGARGTGLYSCRVEEDSDDVTMMQGRAFRVILEGGATDRVIGKVGILRMPILRNFSIKKGMASMMEIDIDAFL